MRPSKKMLNSTSSKQLSERGVSINTGEAEESGSESNTAGDRAKTVDTGHMVNWLPEETALRGGYTPGIEVPQSVSPVESCEEVKVHLE